MKHRILCMLTLCAVLFLTACGGKGLKVELEALENNQALLSGIPPCCTVEDVLAAGVPLAEAPFHTQENAEKTLESIVYQVQDKAFILNVAGQKCESSLFQFINGKFTNLTVNLSDDRACDAVVAELTRLYGDPVVEEQMDGRILQNLWNFTEGEYPVCAAVIGRNEGGKVVLGTFQVSYGWCWENE